MGASIEQLAALRANLPAFAVDSTTGERISTEQLLAEMTPTDLQPAVRLATVVPVTEAERLAALQNDQAGETVVDVHHRLAPPEAVAAPKDEAIDPKAEFVLGIGQRLDNSMKTALRLPLSENAASDIKISNRHIALVTEAGSLLTEMATSNQADAQAYSGAIEEITQAHYYDRLHRAASSNTDEFDGIAEDYRQATVEALTLLHQVDNLPLDFIVALKQRLEAKFPDMFADSRKPLRATLIEARTDIRFAPESLAEVATLAQESQGAIMLGAASEETFDTQRREFQDAALARLSPHDAALLDAVQTQLGFEIPPQYYNQLPAYLSPERFAAFESAWDRQQAPDQASLAAEPALEDPYQEALAALSEKDRALYEALIQDGRIVSLTPQGLANGVRPVAEATFLADFDAKWDAEHAATPEVIDQETRPVVLSNNDLLSVRLAMRAEHVRITDPRLAIGLLTEASANALTLLGTPTTEEQQLLVNDAQIDTMSMRLLINAANYLSQQTTLPQRVQESLDTIIDVSEQSSAAGDYELASEAGLNVLYAIDWLISETPDKEIPALAQVLLQGVFFEGDAPLPQVLAELGITEEQFRADIKRVVEIITDEAIEDVQISTGNALLDALADKPSAYEIHRVTPNAKDAAHLERLAHAEAIVLPSAQFAYETFAKTTAATIKLLKTNDIASDSLSAVRADVAVSKDHMRAVKNMATLITSLQNSGALSEEIQADLAEPIYPTRELDTAAGRYQFAGRAAIKVIHAMEAYLSSDAPLADRATMAAHIVGKVRNSSTMQERIEAANAYIEEVKADVLVSNRDTYTLIDAANNTPARRSARK
ncbi:MAG TPA: hypothetical protein VFQ63_02750 [Patescibacteria group bacterium]|nr:hypothetical protein [Patescibacteria group bacterium]